MTNCTLEPSTSISPSFRRLLAEQGIEDTRGVEILRLIRNINTTYESVLAEHAQDGRVTPHRWRVLLRIWMEEQIGRGAVRPTLISRSEHVSKNTVSEHLRGLEEAGLIKRELDTEDRRQFKIGLTQAGRDLIVRSTPVHMRQLNQLLAGLSTEDIAQLHTLLARLHSTIISNASQMPIGCEVSQHNAAG